MEEEERRIEKEWRRRVEERRGKGEASELVKCWIGGW